jgi:hypothetical protein
MLTQLPAHCVPVFVASGGPEPLEPTRGSTIRFSAAIMSRLVRAAQVVRIVSDGPAGVRIPSGGWTRTAPAPHLHCGRRGPELEPYRLLFIDTLYG